MSAQEILAELPKLSVAELKAIAELCAQLEAEKPAEPPKPRIFGLHAGAWEVANDFDDPLPDSFWLGKDA